MLDATRGAGRTSAVVPTHTLVSTHIAWVGGGPGVSSRVRPGRRLRSTETDVAGWVGAERGRWARLLLFPRLNAQRSARSACCAPAIFNSTAVTLACPRVIRPVNMKFARRPRCLGIEPSQDVDTAAGWDEECCPPPAPRIPRCCSRRSGPGAATFAITMNPPGPFHRGKRKAGAANHRLRDGHQRAPQLFSPQSIVAVSPARRPRQGFRNFYEAPYFGRFWPSERPAMFASSRNTSWTGPVTSSTRMTEEMPGL